MIRCETPGFRGVAKAVMSGATVVYPTDTVYALGSIPSSESGAERCFESKRRDRKPMPVLFSTLDAVNRVVSLDQRALSLATGFWPGPLTLILPLKENAKIASRLRGENNTLGVRIPDHACCLELISSCGGSLIGTSANISGESPSIECDDPKLVEFASGADYFVKGKCGPTISASTVVDISLRDSINFVREGLISRKAITAYLEKTSRTDLSASNAGT